MIIIAGGGISGLSAAYFLQKSGIDCMVMELAPEPGGCIRSKYVNGYLLEGGPNSILCSEYLLSLIDDLGLKEHILPSTSLNKHRFIYKKGRYRKLPSGPMHLLFGDFFSSGTKFKILKELFRKPGVSGEEFLQDFFVAHFGNEVAEYALNPFVSGIYAGDPSKLLVAETFPSLIKFEKENGSLLKGMIKNAGSRKKLISFKDGIQVLPKKIAEQINISYNTEITSIVKSKEGFSLQFSDGGVAKSMEVGGMVLALPAYTLSELLRSSYPKISAVCDSVHYPPMTVVHTAYRKEEVKGGLNGFGGLNPKVENRFSAGSIWTSSVFPFRVPKDVILLTTFVGGSQYEVQANNPDEVICKRVHEEHKESFKILGEPVFQSCTRWPKGLPQYDKNILAMKGAATELEKEHLYICSNVFDGVSIEDCIRKGETVAKKIQIAGIR